MLFGLCFRLSIGLFLRALVRKLIEELSQFREVHFGRFAGRQSADHERLCRATEGALEQVTGKLALGPFAGFRGRVDMGALRFVAADEAFFGHDLHEFQDGAVLSAATARDDFMDVADSGRPDAPENRENFEFGVGGAGKIVWHSTKTLLVKSSYVNNKNALPGAAKTNRGAFVARGVGIGYSQSLLSSVRDVGMTGLLQKLLPREASFFRMFNEQAENVQAGARALVEMLRNYGDPATAANRVKAYEHAGDTITHDVVKKLNQTFITPFDREDIHELATRIDDVIDLVHAVATRLFIYRIQAIRPGVLELAETVRDSTGQIVAAVRVLEKGDHILDYCIEINRLENVADRQSRELIAQLFDQEKDPVQIIKWKEIIETLEFAADKCEDVANVIETVTLKNA